MILGFGFLVFSRCGFWTFFQAFYKSTGKFVGATGPGAHQVFFGAYAPRYTPGNHKGQCDTASNSQPLAKSAVATSSRRAVLTVG